MNKIYLILLIILSSGIFPSCRQQRKLADRIFNTENNTQIIKDDIRKYNEQLTTEIQTINNNIEKLRILLNDKSRLLTTDIQKNNEQIKTELKKTINNNIENLGVLLNDNFMRLTADIQKNNKQLKRDIETGNDNLENLIVSLNDKQLDKNGLIKAELEKLISTLNHTVQKMNSDNLNNINQLETTMDENISGIDKNISKQKLFWVIVSLAILSIVACVFFFLKYKMARFDHLLRLEMISSIEELNKDKYQLDTKLMQIMERQLEIGQTQLNAETKPDHSLPIKVCEEIQRMRNRLKHMNQEDQGSKVFAKRLESLEEKLNEMGYEMVSLENTPYNEGMTVKASFITNENMKESDEIITRVIKPQINYNDELIQAADVEVSLGKSK